MEALKTFLLSQKTPATLQEINFSESLFTLDEISNQLPSGAYTTFRTFEKYKALRLEGHFKRLEETAHLSGFSLLINRAITREQIKQALKITDFPESRLRLTVDLQKNFGQIFLSIEPLITPPDCEYQMGVRAITQEMHRENPKAKLTTFIRTAYSIRKNMDTAINEVLMLNAEGQILEGLSSNFFAVIKGEIWTADSGVLSGITRALTLEEARRAGVMVILNPPSVDRHTEFQEAFITSTSRDVLPVVQIDEFKIANGLPGPISQNLLNRYRVRVASEVEQI